MFDAVAAGLLLAGLAYSWLGNVAHEVIGTAMFLLVILHNVFNRRRYAGMARARREPRGMTDIAVTIVLVVTMLVLLVTSLMISNWVFGVLSLGGGFTAKQVHALAAYWALIIVSIHLGLRWPTVMGAARSICGIVGASSLRTWVLRSIALALVVQGIRSSFELAIGAKVTMEITPEWWDFETSAGTFFLHCIAVAGLYIVLAYYVAHGVLRKGRGAPFAARMT